MAASDYITQSVYVASTANRVEKQVYTSYLVPKSALLVALGEKLDTDFAALNALLAAAGGKMDTDFTAQNAAVTNSQLDVNYTAAFTSTVDEDYADDLADS